MLHAMSLSELDVGDGRTGIVMTDLAVNYKAESRLFDELLIETHVDEFTRTGFRLFHRVTTGERLVALVNSGFVAFNYASKRVAPVPSAFVKGRSDSTRPPIVSITPDVPTSRLTLSQRHPLRRAAPNPSRHLRSRAPREGQFS